MPSNHFHQNGGMMSRGKYEDMLEGRRYKNSHDMMDDYSGNSAVQEDTDSYLRSHEPNNSKLFYKKRLGLGFCATVIKSKESRI